MIYGKTFLSINIKRQFDAQWVQRNSNSKKFVLGAMYNLK